MFESNSINNVSNVNYSKNAENLLPKDKLSEVKVDDREKKAASLDTSQSKREVLESDKVKIDKYFDGIANKIREKYDKDLDEINNSNLSDDDKKRGANIVKAKSVIANLSRGVVVSSSDIAFAAEILPEEVSKARTSGDEFRRSKIEEIRKSNNYIDYKI